MSLFTWSFQLDLRVSGRVRGIFSSVRFIRSTKLFPCGWYGVVIEYTTPENSSNRSNKRFSNFPPMPWWSFSGNPKRGIRSLKILSAAVTAVLFFVGYAWAYLVKWSTTTRMYLWPPELRSRRTKSMESIWRGAVRTIGCNGSLVGRFGRLCFRQRHVWWIKLCISLLM